MKMGRRGKNDVAAWSIPTLRDLAWAAGFLEGEGCFHSTNRGVGKTEAITANQVNPEPLIKLQSFVGGKVVKQVTYNPNHQPQWRWQVSGSRARGIMLTLYTLLSATRQSQIKQALKQP